MKSARAREFPGYRTLMIVLHDLYMQVGECERGERLLRMIRAQDEGLADEMEVSFFLRSGNWCGARDVVSGKGRFSGVEEAIDLYVGEMKSPEKASRLNGIIPGLGYAYLGQGNTAFTSFTINALFIAATWMFIDDEKYAAAAITGSLEVGWYMGGINGGAIAANRYNREMYRRRVGDSVRRERLYPIHMLRHGF